MKCKICGSNMRLYAKGKNGDFYRCGQCHFYDTISKIESMNYENYETFDATKEGEQSNRDRLLIEAIHILSYKFEILGYIPDSFLDIGCSEGIFVEAYNRISAKTGYGIEVSRSKIQRCRQRGLEVGDYNDADGKYSFILLRHVIEHIDSPKEYLRDISNRFLSSDGVIWIETPNNDCPTDFLKGRWVREGLYCRDLYPPIHLCGFTEKTFKYIDIFDVKRIMTHNVYDTRWYYNSSQKEDIKRAILRRIPFSNNVVAILGKRKA